MIIKLGKMMTERSSCPQQRSFVDESAWSDLKQKVKAMDLNEPPELDAVDTLQQEELQLKENRGAPSSVSIYATCSKGHGEETEEPSSCRSNYTNLTKTHHKEATEASSHGGDDATDLGVHGNESASDQGAECKLTAKSRLYEICAANHWVAPKFICHKEEGPSHNKWFTYKVTVEVKDATRTVLECFSGSKSKKKAAAEHAAEGALWYLQHLGHKI